LGVQKLRITGGEPLLRRDLPALVEMLRDIPGITDIALTTNGLLLPELARPLRDAGLNRLTVSLDSLDAETLARVSGRRIDPDKVLSGIEAARNAGFGPIKVNTVIQRGVNESDALPIAEYARGIGAIVRFIEYMDVGNLNDWRRDAVVTSAELLDRISARYPLVPADPQYRGEVATRYRYADGAGEVGFISSISQPFCRDCTRLRLSPSGELYTCLFAQSGHSLKPLLRDGAEFDEIAGTIRTLWNHRNDRYSELRAQSDPTAKKVEMYHIGG